MNENTKDGNIQEAGRAIRREVLGSEFVDASDKVVDDFVRPFREFVDTYCWGKIWTRPVLERKTRSIINLAMLCSLNRSHELKLHLRGALNNGVTKEEIREIFMQVAVYAGVPAGVEAFRVAREVFVECERK